MERTSQAQQELQVYCKTESQVVSLGAATLRLASLYKNLVVCRRLLLSTCQVDDSSCGGGGENCCAVKFPASPACLGKLLRCQLQLVLQSPSAFAGQILILLTLARTYVHCTAPVRLAEAAHRAGDGRHGDALFPGHASHPPVLVVARRNSVPSSWRASFLPFKLGATSYRPSFLPN